MTHLPLDTTSAPTRRALESVLAGNELDSAEAISLCEVAGADLDALVATANRLRSEQAGDHVTYVVNRNINFTNACVKSCHFCAFSRKHRTGQAYMLDAQEIVRRALEAQSYGATEVCLQAGLAPGLDGRFYVDLCRAVKRAAPDLHVHAFSPEEVKYGARRSGMTIADYLRALKDAGLGSLPGTSAEILDDSVRDVISPGRITTSEWIEVVTGAHALDIPTTATIMFGHVETGEQRVRHLMLLRELQQRTGGFTEIVPLSFVHDEAPLYARNLVPMMRPGPTRDDVTRTFALCRLILGSSFRNVQVSWVKQGIRRATELLSCGVNDLGGTLMNESISTSAGAPHGQLMTPATLRGAIRSAGRVPAERTTLYRIRREFSHPGDDDPAEPLDEVREPNAVFGSYDELVRDDSRRFHFIHPHSMRF